MTSGAPHVSASSLRLIGDCPRAWWYRYAAGHPAESQAAATVLGRGVHESLAAYYLALRDEREPPSIDDLVEIAEQVISEATKGAVPVAFDEGEDATTLGCEAARLLRTFMISPFRPERVLAVEAPFALEVRHHPITGEAFDVDEVVSGVFDLVVEDREGNIAIIDHKTGKRRPVCDGGFDLQMALYGWAGRQIYGRRVQLFHHILLRTKVAVVALHPIAATEQWEAEAIENVVSGISLIHVAVTHPNPVRLMGRRRSWRCDGCNYATRCADERA